MKQSDFVAKMVELILEWDEDYIKQRETSGDPENWPSNRDQEDWISDFQVWLQCKGYTI